MEGESISPMSFLIFSLRIGLYGNLYVNIHLNIIVSWKEKNRVIAEVARSMLNEKRMPHLFWDIALSTIVYLINTCPTTVIHVLTPE